MRLTTRTTLAVRALMVCAANPERVVRKADVAARIGASENHLAQVINQLGQEGYLTTLRGRNGGIVLARAPQEISVGALFRVVEGRSPIVECMSDDTACPLSEHCVMTQHLHRAVEAFYATLDPITLSDLVTCNTGLETLLRLTEDTRRNAELGCTTMRATSEHDAQTAL